MLTRSLTRPITLPATRFITGPRVMSASIWTPAALFAQGQQGVWYEPKPQYLFQDAAGTVPVTADGDPVGLMLDLHKGLEPGSELVANGTFDSGIDGWVAGNTSAALSHSDGRLRITNIEANKGTAVSSPAVTPEVGRFYEIRFAVGPDPASGFGRLILGGVDIRFTVAGGESYYGIHKATTTTELTLVNDSSTDGATIEYDNISVRELPGNHVPQSTASLKPLYAITPDQLGFDEFDDVLPVTFPVDMGTDVTIGRAVPGVGGEILTGQTVGTSYDITQDMAALIIINETPSAADLDKLQSYLNTMAGV